MDKIAFSLETVCFVSILAGIIGALIPQGKLKGAFSSFCAVVLVFCFIEPLSEIRGESFGALFTDDVRSEEELLSDVNTAEKQLYENLLEKGLEEKLDSIGCSAEVKAECEKNEDEYKTVTLTVKGKLTAQEKYAAEIYLKEGFPAAEIKFEETEDDRIDR